MDPSLAAELKARVGFRNIAVHQYRELDLGIVEGILAEGLDRRLAFAQQIRAAIGFGMLNRRRRDVARPRSSLEECTDRVERIDF